MRTLRFSINVKAVDSYLYGGYLFLALEDGALGYVPMSRIMHRLKERYPEFTSLLRLAFERNDFFSNETGKTFLGIPEVMEVMMKLGPLEKVCGYRSTIKILFCPFIKLNNG